MARPVWQPAPLWPLPPCAYENNTARYTPLKKAVCWVVGLTLFLPRLLLLLFSLFSVYGIAKLTVIGWDPKAKDRRPMPLWRYRIQKTLVPPLVRLNLLSLGFFYIPIRGSIASPEQAPVLVSNHQTFVDIWLWLWQLLPVGVSAAENMRFPIMGEIMLAFQTIFVDRDSQTSGRGAAQLIAATLEDKRFPQVVVYPEGNTGNGTSLAAFKAGAFSQGVPVQPVTIQYSNPLGLDLSWCEPLGIPVHVLALSMLVSPWNTMKVTYLDPVKPTAAENKDPRMFQERVRALMAANLKVPMSDYSFGDTSLMFRARKVKLPPRSALLEMDRATRVFGLGVTEAKECLEHFARGAKTEAAADATRLAGTVGGEGLVVALGMTATALDTPAVRSALLATFDQDGSGAVTFREFVAGLAPLARTATLSGSEGPSFYVRATEAVRTQGKLAAL